MGKKIGSGRTIEVSQEWAEDAKRRMAEMGIDQRALAARVRNPTTKRPVDEATISRFFKMRKSRLANEIADALGMPRPYMLVNSRAEWQWIEMGRFAGRLAEERRAKLVAAVKAYTGQGSPSAAEAELALEDLVPPSRVRT